MKRKVQVPPPHCVAVGCGLFSSGTRSAKKTDTPLSRRRARSISTQTSDPSCAPSRPRKQVVVESRDKAPGTLATMHIGKLSLVDLAGSERSVQ